MGVERRPVNMFDVAKAAGVSHQTVSRVLNDSAAVKESTRSRVNAAIDELGYHRNLAAQIFLLGAEFTKVYAQEHGSAAAKARPPQVVPDAEATQAPATPLPDYSGLTRAVEMQKEVDLRVTKGVSAVLPKIALLAVVSLLNLFADKRMKNLQKHRRERRSSARALKSGS